MNRQGTLTLFIICGILFLTFSAKSFEVPSYIEDPQNVNDNICIIIDENTPDKTTGATVTQGNRQVADTIGEYAARLYADAISIRANMVNASGSGNEMMDASGELGGMAGGEAGKAIQGVTSMLSGLIASKDKASVLQNELKTSVKNIAMNLKQIVELEAGIANLEGLQVLTSLSGTKCKEDEEEEQ